MPFFKASNILCQLKILLIPGDEYRIYKCCNILNFEVKENIALGEIGVLCFFMETDDFLKEPLST